MKRDKWLGVLALVIQLIGVVLGIYVGIWRMIVMSIIGSCRAYELGTLTNILLIWAIIKVLFGGSVGSIIIQVSTIISEEILKR